MWFMLAGLKARKFWWQVLGLLYKWLNRRSHRRSYTWESFLRLLKDFHVPAPRIVVETPYRAPAV